MPRPHPVMPRVAHHPEAPPRDLFVPAVNERVGMNDRGRPSGSPLRHPRFCRADSMRDPQTGGVGINGGGLRMRRPNQDRIGT